MRDTSKSTKTSTKIQLPERIDEKLSDLELKELEFRLDRRKGYAEAGDDREAQEKALASTLERFGRSPTSSVSSDTAEVSQSNQSTLAPLKEAGDNLRRSFAQDGGLQELARLAETLNSESNDLNATIAAISKKLAALNLGIEVWIAGTQEGTEVGFGKVPSQTKEAKDMWQLAVRADWGNVLDGGKTAMPLLSASRDLRIEGLSHVHYFVRQLTIVAEEKIQVMQEAKKLAAEL